MNNFDDLLAGCDGFEYFLADTLCLDISNELTGNLEVNISREEGFAHFFERIGHILFGQFAHPAQVAEGRTQFVCKIFEHFSVIKSSWR